MGYLLVVLALVVVVYFVFIGPKFVRKPSVWKPLPPSGVGLWGNDPEADDPDPGEPKQH